MPRNKYNNAEPEKALEQASDKTLIRWKEKWDFAPLQLHTSRDLRRWLRRNTICDAPIRTPYRLQNALDELEKWLGVKDPSMSKKVKGFSRVGTVRVKKQWAVSGPTRRTVYKPSARYDYGDHATDSRKWLQNTFVATACSDIAREFLAVTGYGSFLHAILNPRGETSDGYRAYVHVDWYPLRTYQAVTWHKDTQGHTLFVGLIYMNAKAIPGPDVIANPWPLGAKLDRDRKPCRLPPKIKAQIDQILRYNFPTPMKIEQTGIIPAGGGMVWFIDELIHHRTPQNHVDANIKIAISEQNLGKLPGLIDTSERDNWRIFKDRKTPRQFIRLWVTLEHRDWKPVDDPSQTGRFKMGKRGTHW